MAAVVSARDGDALDESVYQGSEASPPQPPPSWAYVPADILGGVLLLLPCVADRASVRSVCRHWRAAAHARVQALPAPLPVLVLPRFIRFSCLTSDSDGAARLMTAARRALMPVVAAGDDVWTLGSCDDWLMAVKQTGDRCFLVNAFSREVSHLPCLQINSHQCYHCLDDVSSSPVGTSFHGWMLRSALSASPSSSVSKYSVAAYTYRGGGSHPGLALWQPGMTSWYLCRSSQINSFSGDLAFYQGKLYMVWMYTADIFAFELREDEHGLSLSCPEHYAINPLIHSRTIVSMRCKCNMVVWRGKLLLVIRIFSDSMYEKTECKPHSVEVFALDFSTRPCGVTQIQNFDGDCIFVQKSGCRSFSAGLHVGVQGDLIYFLDEGITNHGSYTYVHNMRDGTLWRIAAGLPPPNSGVPQKCFPDDFPVWIFPSS